MEATELVVRKSVAVAAAPDHAYRVFTERIGDWWPAARHSIGGEDVVDVVLEGRVGGRIYERLADGTEHEWGRVTRWEPPARLAFSWHPGRAAGTAQTVEVLFTPTDGGTRVDLEQRGWDRLGDEAEAQFRSYDAPEGWTTVLGLYADAAADGT